MVLACLTSFFTVLLNQVFRSDFWILNYLSVLLVGAFLGWLYGKISGSKLKENSYNKKGIYYRNYPKGELIKRLQDMLRHVIVRFRFDSMNSSFLVNLKIDNQTVCQLLHRSHFVELIENENDNRFGVAIYISLEYFDDKKRESLFSLLEKESVKSSDTDSSYKYSYVVIDGGLRVRYISYIISKILENIFDVINGEKMSFEIYDEGRLPYEKISEAKQV
jgi:hypothetical protein